MEGVQAFILSVKGNHRTNTYTESLTKNIRNIPVPSRDFNYVAVQKKVGVGRKKSKDCVERSVGGGEAFEQKER